jgi:two-component system response regulator YesN
MFASSEENVLSTAEIVDRLEQFLRTNFTQPISYKMFNDLYGYNETYLSHIFKVRKGITPNKYITQLRIEKVKELMKSSPDTSLRNIASMVGYEDAFYFSRVFKDATGLSPSEYIKHESGSN